MRSREQREPPTPSSATPSYTFGPPSTRDDEFPSDWNSTSSNRWSDVIPPQTALTFAVVWDPEDDMVGFSGAELLDSSDEVKSFDSPSDAYDTHSQVLSLETGNNLPSDPSFRSDSLAFFRDQARYLLPDGSGLNLKRGHTQTSSTLDGFDVYARGSLLGKVHGNRRGFSCLKALDQNFQFDPRTSFAKAKGSDNTAMGRDFGSVTDEGFFENSLLRFRAHPSQSDLSSNCISTRGSPSRPGSPDLSGFVTVTEEDASSLWSTLEQPEWPTILHRGDQQRHVKRRLRKRRPAGMPAPPSEVLGRDHYSYSIPGRAQSLPPQGHPNSRSHCQTLTKVVRGLGKLSKTADSERWVYVDVTQKIRQYCI